MTAAGEPPTPGMSNRITGRRGSSTSTNGCSSSRLTPMPLHSSSGGQPGSPSRTETRSDRPPIDRILIRVEASAFRDRPGIQPRRADRRPFPAGPCPAGSFPAGSDPGWSAVIDVRSRRLADRQQPAAAEFGRRGGLLPAPLGQPARVVRPPASLPALGLPQELLRILRAVARELVLGLGVAGRVDHGGDVTAGRQQEPWFAAEQLGGPVAA